MIYKILEIHMAYRSEAETQYGSGAVTITVAIQSNPTQEPLSRWKAYSLELTSDSVFNFQRVAASGSKLTPERAAQIFSHLNKAFHYEN